MPLETLRRSRRWLAPLGLLLAAPGVPAEDHPRGRARGRAFWTALAGQCDVPPGETAIALVREAVSFLGAPESAWRDDVGYGVVAACVYRKRALAPEERRELVAGLLANLRSGIGEAGTDSVLLRSFSALDLSILAALEGQEPALDEAGYRRLLEDALAYLRDERDLRGLAPGLGWVHAIAHTADLLKFLARDPRFAPRDQTRLLEAAWARMTAPGTPVFTHAEDERLAAAIASVVRRADFDEAAFAVWLERFPPQEQGVWSENPPEPTALDAAQNSRNLLRSLYVLLSLPAPATSGAATSPAPGVSAARERVLATLQAIRRS
jgi:hypothetical protein